MKLTVNLKTTIKQNDMAISSLPYGFFIADSVKATINGEVYESEPRLYCRRGATVLVFEPAGVVDHYSTDSFLTFYNVRIPKSVNIQVEE
jgi:hypothetical protein